MMRKPRPRLLGYPYAPPLRWWDMEGMRIAARERLNAAFEQEASFRPGFMWLPVAYGLGILVYFAAEQEPEFWAGPLLISIILLILARQNDSIFRMMLMAALFVALGFTAGTFRTIHANQGTMLAFERNVTMSGYVETVDPLAQRQRIILRPHMIDGVSPHAMPFRMQIGISAQHTVSPGHYIRLNARVQPPADPALPGGYDFRRNAFFKGIGGVGYAMGAIMHESPPASAPLDLRISAQIDRWRNTMTQRIAQSIGGEAGALAAALVTGKRGSIANETNDALRASGLYHIVSISGLHMVLAAGVFFWLVRAMLALSSKVALRYPIKKIAALVAMAGASFYCLFSGSEVATERSLIMTLVMLGAILFDRPALAMRNVALSALIVLTREPEALLGPSFQMSYAAVACLIAANQMWRDRHGSAAKQDVSLLRPKDQKPSHNQKRQKDMAASFAQKILLALAGIIATTIIASLATAPFSAFHFHRLNPFGVIGNALAIPLVSLIVMPAAVAGVLLVPFGLDGIIWRIMGEGVSGVLIVAEKVAAFEHSSLPTPLAEPASFAVLIAGILVLVLFRSQLRWFAAPLFVLAALLYRAALLPDILVDPAARVVMFRGEGGTYRLLSPSSAQNFTLAQWLPAVGDARSPNDASLKTGTFCDKTGCTGRLGDGRSIALTVKPESLREDCIRADILITPLILPAFCQNSAGKRIIDKTQLERFGAMMIQTDRRENWRITSTLSPEINRPWRKIVQVKLSPEQNQHAVQPLPPTIILPEDDPGLTVQQ